MRSRPVLVCAALAVALMHAAPSSATPDLEVGNTDRSSWYAAGGPGYWTEPSAYVRVDETCESLAEPGRTDCSLDAFRSKPFTVIAFIDTGINPYAEDFAAPEFVHHPSAYIEGYPADARALDLDLDEPDYETARAADDLTWLRTNRGELRWIPGTRIVGAISFADGDTDGVHPERKILDDHGHGTGVASVAAGRVFGANPNALIVTIEGLGSRGLRWASEQPWIDVVSNSWGPTANIPVGSASAVRAATGSGKVVAFAAGNGVTNQRLPVVGVRPPDSNPSLTSPYGGQRDVVTVGAASPVNGQDYWWHSWPVDVSSFGGLWPAVSAFDAGLKSRNFGGTSCATPITAGVISSLVQRAREVFGDTTEGPEDAGLAVATPGRTLPSAGPLADGALTRADVVDAVTKTAYPVPFDPGDTERLADDYPIRPTTDRSYVFSGYGIVDRDSRARAWSVLTGAEPLPSRPDVDEWMALVDAARTIWDHAPDTG